MKLNYPSQFPTYSYLASPDETEKEGPSALQPAHILAIRGNAATISSLYDLSLVIGSALIFCNIVIEQEVVRQCSLIDCFGAYLKLIC